MVLKRKAIVEHPFGMVKRRIELPDDRSLKLFSQRATRQALCHSASVIPYSSGKLDSHTLGGGSKSANFYSPATALF